MKFSLQKKSWILGFVLSAGVLTFFLLKKEPDFYSQFLETFKKVEFGDRNGIVLGVKNISIRGVEHPYNASIVKYGDTKYLMSFRYDVLPSNKKEKPQRRIGIAEFHSDFTQTEKEFAVVDTKSPFSEDARLFVFQGDYYLIYNDLIDVKEGQEWRSVHLGKLNLTDFSLEFITNLDQKSKRLEKNWVPIVHKESDGKEQLYLGYDINPHTILKLNDPKKNEIEHQILPESAPLYDISWWTWGLPRGGSPSLLVGKEYLAFFHSSFRKPGKNIRYWYVMGAYTFEPQAPFRVSQFSKEPILFSDLYSTPPDTKFVDKHRRVVYPSGFVEGHENGRDVFYVSIGENDCATKIVTIDKERLYQSLKPVPIR